MAVKDLVLHPSKKRTVILIVLGILFVLFNTILLVEEIYWFTLLPLAFMFGLLLLFYTEKALFLTVFLVPLSINLGDLDFGLAISLPAEPLMMGLVLVILLCELYQPKINRQILKHPISILIFAHLIWFLFTSITSEMPFVSLKAFMSQLWFIVPFYFFSAHVFLDLRKIHLFFWVSIVPLALVILYSTYGLWNAGFDEELSQSVMTPFYPNHTAYGAVIALFLPFLFLNVFDKNKSNLVRGLACLLALVFCAGIILSYSRAVWASIPPALAIALAIVFKIRFKTIMIGCLGVLGLVFVFHENILMDLGKNKQDSSDKISENIQSISNITTDDSNTERLNRWSSAISMFKERPVFGWGPGTFQFQYAPFQKSKDLTLISTNAGSLGNAHSEYLGPLAERGFLGAGLFLSMLIYSLFLSFRIYETSNNPLIKLAILSIIMGLITYYIHGFLNNYLDIDKVAIPFWALIAMITALDIHCNKAT